MEWQYIIVVVDFHLLVIIAVNECLTAPGMTTFNLHI
jgi:hypothetical protein